MPSLDSMVFFLLLFLSLLDLLFGRDEISKGINYMVMVMVMEMQGQPVYGELLH